MTFEKTDAHGVAEVANAACRDTWEVCSVEETAGRLGDFDCWTIVKGEAIGVVICKGREAHIAVLPEHRKSWASKAFYRFMEELVRVRGVLQVRCGNPGAESFLKKLEKRGFLWVI